MKRLKVWSIVTSVICVFLLVLSYFCLFKNQGLGQFLAIIAEDITSTGHNVDNLLQMLLFCCIVGTCVFFIINQILIFAYVRAAKMEEEIDEGVDEGKPVVLVDTADKTVKTTKKKKKKNVTIDAIEDTVNSAASAVNEASNKVTSTVNNTNEALAKFLDSFRK